MANLSSLVVAIEKPDASILNPLQTVIGQSNTENIATQVREDLFARTGMSTMDDPGLRPDIGSDKLEKSGLVQSGPHLCPEDQ